MPINLRRNGMNDPDPPKQLPPNAYPPRSFWWRFLRIIRYPKQIIDWKLFTWDEVPPANRDAAFKETRRELRKPPQNILQDAMEQLGTNHEAREAAIQKSTVALLAVSAYETQRATWWLQLLTWILVIGTTILVCQTQKLLNLERKSVSESHTKDSRCPDQEPQKANPDISTSKEIK